MSRLVVLVNVMLAGLAGWCGCVSVDTPDTHVKVGITSLNLPGSSSADTDEAPYARAMKKVAAQQSEVAEQLGKRDWEETVQETGDWIRYTRELAGYAETSHDPALFRACCEQLTQRAQALERAAMSRDLAGSQQAFAACDPPLDQLMRSFPLIRLPGQATVASPQPPARPPVRPPAERPPRIP